MTYPGGDTVYLVAMQPTGVVDDLNKAIVGPVVTATVYGCVFESLERGPVEEQSDTITSHEKAWVFLPFNTTTAAIVNSGYIRPKRGDGAERDYKVIGLPIEQYDIDGAPDHIWVTCEWRAG